MPITRCIIILEGEIRISDRVKLPIKCCIIILEGEIRISDRVKVPIILWNNYT